MPRRAQIEFMGRVYPYCTKVLQGGRHTWFSVGGWAFLAIKRTFMKIVKRLEHM